MCRFKKNLIKHIMYEKIYHIITDIEGNYVYVNPYFKERFEYLHNNFLGCSSINSIFSDDITVALAATKRLLSHQSVVEYLELRKPNPDGTFFWTFWEFKLNYDASNNPNGIVCIGYDITKLKKTDINNLDVRKLINCSNIISNLSSFSYDIAADSIKPSQEFYDIYHFDKNQEIKIHGIFDKIHPDDLHLVDKKLIENLKTNKNIVNIAYRIVDPHFENGLKYLETVFEYYHNPCSEKAYILGVTFDITKIKKRENAYDLIISYLKSVFDTSENAMAVINKEFKLVTYNKEFLKVSHKFEIEPQIGQYILEYIPDAYKSKIISLYNRAFEGETIKLDFNIYYPDGSFLSDTSYYPLKNDANEVKFIVIKTKFNDVGIILPNEKIKIAKSIIDFQEAEKNRIAIDLHDSVNQLLYIAKLNLSEIPESKAKLVVSEMLVKATAEIKAIINNSSQFVLENTTLSEAIAYYISVVFKDSTTKHELKYSQEPTVVISYDKKLSIFRIIQEIAQNVCKHASAKNFKIKLKILTSKIVLITADNGNGFEYSKLSTGKGLENIKNRVYLMNGEIKVRTKYKKGTVFLIVISNHE